MANIKDLLSRIESGLVSHEEKLAALSQVENAIKEMKQKKQEAIQSNVSIIVDTLKTIQAKVEAQLAEAKAIVPEKGPKGDKGDKGLDGRNGKDGKDGRDGLDGKQGEDGKDGISVSTARVDFDGSLIIVLSNGTEINAGEVVGELQDRTAVITQLNALLPDQYGNSGKYLTTDGNVLSWDTPAVSLAKSVSVFTSGTSQTYTAPSNTTWVKVTVVGPGGTGGGAASQRATGGGGGGVAIKWLAMTAGQTLSYTVGTASGTASTVSSGTLTISTLTANSGSNGAGTSYASGNTAGAAGGTATGGDINLTGGQGGYSFGSSTTVTTNFSGKGGDCPGFGSGGPALAMAITAGVQGNGYGAGGGGAHGSATTAAGRGGIIIFEAY